MEMEEWQAARRVRGWQQRSSRRGGEGQRGGSAEGLGLRRG